MPQQIYHVTVTTRLRAPLFSSFEAASAAARCFIDHKNLRDSTLRAWC